MHARLSREWRRRRTTCLAISTDGVFLLCGVVHYRELHHGKLRKPTAVYPQRRKISAGDTTIATLRFVTFRHGTNRAFLPLSLPPALPLTLRSPEPWAPLAMHRQVVENGGNTRARPCCTKIHIHRGRQTARHIKAKHDHRNIFAHTFFFPPRGYTIREDIRRRVKRGSLPLALK